MDGVGGVSPKLLHADDMIQYAGMISVCGTAYNNVRFDARDCFLPLHDYVRDVSILSGACCALRNGVFWEVGAFDETNTPDAHSDLDLSISCRRPGFAASIRRTRCCAMSAIIPGQPSAARIELTPSS